MYKLYYANNFETKEEGVYDIYEKNFETIEEASEEYLKVFYLNMYLIIEEIKELIISSESQKEKEVLSSVKDTIKKLGPNDNIVLNGKDKVFLTIEPFHLNYDLFHTIELHIDEEE